MAEPWAQWLIFGRNCWKVSNLFAVYSWLYNNMQGMNQDLLDEIDARPQYSLVHVRIQARTARKSLTLIEGMPQDIDLKKVLRYFKKAFQFCDKITQ